MFCFVIQFFSSCHYLLLGSAIFCGFPLQSVLFCYVQLVLLPRSSFFYFFLLYFTIFCRYRYVLLFFAPLYLLLFCFLFSILNSDLIFSTLFGCLLLSSTLICFVMLWSAVFCVFMICYTLLYPLCSFLLHPVIFHCDLLFVLYFHLLCFFRPFSTPIRLFPLQFALFISFLPLSLSSAPFYFDFFAVFSSVLLFSAVFHVAQLFPAVPCSVLFHSFPLFSTLPCPVCCFLLCYILFCFFTLFSASIGCSLFRFAIFGSFLLWLAPFCPILLFSALFKSDMLRSVVFCSVLPFSDWFRSSPLWLLPFLLCSAVFCFFYPDLLCPAV